jgi:ABC-type phosphate/phosphonate transport system permease subunit
MSAGLIVLILGLAGLALVARLLIREPDMRVRVAAIGGAVGGFLLALALALAFGRDTLDSVATATLGAAVLPLTLIAQWRFIRSLFARQGREL